MKDKKRESYDVAFDLVISALKKVMPAWTPDEWKECYWMTDFECAMRDSIKARFPVVLLGCYFHYRGVLMILKREVWARTFYQGRNK